MENEIIRLKSIIKEKDMTIEQLKLELNKSNKNIIKKGEDMTKLEMEMKKMDIEIKRLKIDLQVKINENKDNKRIKVIFKSPKINECVIESFENASYTNSKDGKSISLIEKISTGKNEEEILTNKLVVNDLINSLEQRDKELILLRFFKEKTQSQVAKILGITQVQVSRIERKILNSMRLKLST